MPVSHQSAYTDNINYFNQEISCNSVAAGCVCIVSVSVGV